MIQQLGIFTSVRVFGDLTRLIQVVANLLNNAAKYQHEGGLGIGRSLVRTLVEMHGGTVHARSDVNGGGSEFEVRLPALVTEHVRLRATPATAIAPVDGPSRRILVVDDNRDSAESMAMLLRLRGHEVAVAHDAHRAIELAAEMEPTVVLLDIGLPEMDGYEVCRRLRAQGMEDAQIIAMTGYGQERDRQRSIEAGFDAHTVKPVAIEEIAKLLATPRGSRHRNRPQPATT